MSQFLKNIGFLRSFDIFDLTGSAGNYPKGCSSVILLRPKMGVAPHKHDVISMPTQQCTNTKHVSIERYHPVVSIMLRYLDQIKTFGENLCCRKVKIDKNFWGDLPYFALKCDNFPKGLRKKAECPNEAYFLAQKNIKLIKGTRDNFKIHVNFMKPTFLCRLRQDEAYDRK